AERDRFERVECALLARVEVNELRDRDHRARIVARRARALVPPPMLRSADAARVAAVKSPARCTLAGRRVVLEPLRLEHAADLFAGYAQDRAVFRWLPQPRPPETESEMRELVERHLSLRDRGLELPFAQVDTSSGRAVGVTKY